MQRVFTSITERVFAMASDVLAGENIKSLLEQFARETEFPSTMINSVIERWNICMSKARELLDDDDYSKLGAFYRELARYVRDAELKGKQGFSAAEAKECAEVVGIKKAYEAAQVAGNWNHSFDPKSPAFMMEMMRTSGGIDKLLGGKGGDKMAELLLLKMLLGGKL